MELDLIYNTVRTLREQHPNCCLVFGYPSTGYWFVGEDAHTVHRVTGKRPRPRLGNEPTTWIPPRSLELYLRKLIQAGHRCAVVSPKELQRSQELATGGDVR